MSAVFDAIYPRNTRCLKRADHERDTWHGVSLLTGAMLAGRLEVPNETMTGPEVPQTRVGHRSPSIPRPAVDHQTGSSGFGAQMFGNFRRSLAG